MSQTEQEQQSAVTPLSGDSGVLEQGERLSTEVPSLPDAAAQASPHAQAGSARLRRSLVGRVTSTRMHKTVTVLVERRVKHPLYGKYLVQSKKVHAHTDNPLAMGDVVEVQECRPLSKTKTWMVVRVLNRAAS